MAEPDCWDTPEDTYYLSPVSEETILESFYNIEDVKKEASAAYGEEEGVVSYGIYYNYNIPKTI